MRCPTLIAGVLAMSLSATVTAAPNMVDLVRAVERAEAVTKGTVVDVDLDRNRAGRLVYEIDVVTGKNLREVRIDATDGKVLHNSPQRIEGLVWRVYGHGAKGLAGARPLSDILRKLEARTGGKVIDVEFDIEGGQARYEVDLSTDIGVAGLYIDPQTGKRLDFVIDD